MGLPIIGDIIKEVGDLASELIPDADKRLELNIKLREIEDRADARYSAEMIAQTEVNKAEAGHSSIFVAGWRPAVGWGCCAALIYNTIVAPMAGWGHADLGFLQTVLLGMLGIGGMRSFEKVKGVASDVLPLPKKEAPVTPIATPVAKKKKGLDLWPF